MESGIVFDIQRGSLHDGPGIRTTVFLKGCPLRCLWCHNPESQRLSPQAGASGKVYGREMTVAEVMEVVIRDRRFYELSGGGLTLSGGEPTFQFAFALALLRAARAVGIHTVLETSGQLSWERLQTVVAEVDHVLFDYKATGAEMHRRLTGQDGDLIRDNLHRLLAAGVRVTVRCPLVPTVNDSDEHLEAIGRLSRDERLAGVEVLAYHRLGCGKYADLGLSPPEYREPLAPDKLRWAGLLGPRVAAHW